MKGQGKIFPKISDEQGQGIAHGSQSIGYKNFTDFIEKESGSGFRLWIVQYFVCQQMGF